MPTLHWIGKDKVINHHLEVPYRILDKQYAFDDATKSENKIIHGDNLDALKSLLPEYEGKVKCIYIDPPYNTGNEGWVYNDNLTDPKLKKWLHQVVGKEGEDLTRHDKWLCMMYPRLKLLHRLLTEDGAIFISIDDNEQANLKLIMDEIFGGNNFVTNIVWQRAYSPVNLKKTFSQSHDFIVCYTKDWTRLELNKLDRSEEANARYKNPDNDSRGEWKSSDLSVGPAVEANIYEIISPSGRKVLPPKGRSWVLNQVRLAEFLTDNRIWFGPKGDATPSIKKFLTEVKDGITPMSLWTYQEVGHTQDAKKELKEIFEDDLFATPKPTKLMERIIQIGSNPGDVILDSFAGSGTTAHAVLNLNKRDGGNRRFILIETEEYAETITAERVKRVIKGYGDTAGTGGDFDYYTLGNPLMTEDGLLADDASLADIRAYVCYTETGKSITTEKLAEHPYWLARTEDRDHYFYYEKEKLTILDREFLSTVTETMPYYTIWADQCYLSMAFMKKEGITFRKIPRDIRNI